MKFGEKIRRYRENNNLTQKDLGDQLHLTDDAIYKWEAGKSFPDVPMLRNLVELTGYDAETLTNDNRSIEAYYGLPVSAKTFLYEKTINARNANPRIDKRTFRTPNLEKRLIYWLLKHAASEVHFLFFGKKFICTFFVSNFLKTKMHNI